VEPLRILDQREITLWNRVVTQVKVQWKHFSLEEATWELEGDLRKSHPILFQERNEHSGQCFTKGGKDVTSPKNKIFLFLCV
jgi:predicted secreted Zn-dependent protease